MSFFLAFKEMWRTKGRYFLVSLVVALITTLVLFIAALAQGLALSNIQYLSQLEANLLLYKDNADLSIQASRLRLSELNDVERLAGVTSAGPIGSSTATLVFGSDLPSLDVSLIGVEPGKPGEPPAIEGSNLKSAQDETAVIGLNVARHTGLQVGDTFAVQTVQGAEEELHSLEVVGISQGQQNLFQPSIFVPYLTWERIRSKSVQEETPQADIFINIIAVKLENPAEQAQMARRLEEQVGDVQAVDRRTAYEATPGYSAQQSTLNTQRAFTLIIGVLVIGGFFQIQTLQKVPQIGMLKAIGAANLTIALSSMIQIIAVTILGIAIGGGGTLLLAATFPVTIPLEFTVESVAMALLSLLVIGPLGGLVSIRLALQVEPLMALGLTR